MIDSWPGESRRPAKPRRRREPSGDWRDDLICNSDGNPRAIMANAVTALRGAHELARMLRYNEFSDRVEMHREPPWPGGAVPRDWTDHDDLHFTEWLQRQSVMVSVEIAAQATQTVASETSYHPVRDYLDGLTWDGEERLDFWLTRYLSVENTDYPRAVARRFLISAVARILSPGCKVDTILVLEGGQGVGKSSALRVLAEPWFSDDIAQFGTKEAAEQLPGCWIFELAELESLSRVEANRVKAFASRSVDRFRPAYGRRPRNFLRQCVFAGSTNSSDYLRDATGGRRFWPVRCGKISVAELAAARDQLWAESLAAYRAGEKWWFDDQGLIAAAAAEQADRYHGDPWDGMIGDYLSEIRKAQDGDHCSVSLDDILQKVLANDPGKRTQADANRVVRSLTSHGWERFRARFGNARPWLYRPGPGPSAEP